MAHSRVLTSVSEPPHCSSCGCGYADLPRCPQCSGLGYILPRPARDEHAVAAHSQSEQHQDDVAVDLFAAAMKAKLAEARAKGRGGWQDDEPGMQVHLSTLLRGHVDNGDPRDVAIFAMFLHQRGESILPADPAV